MRLVVTAADASGSTTSPSTPSSPVGERLKRLSGCSRTQLGFGALMVVGALLRFATLDVQSFADDEATTVRLMRMTFRGMLSALPDSESTPPLYYVCAWAWSKLFGLGEVGLRSLSALAGTAVIAVVYLAARELGSRHAALLAALVVAVNPLLIWYSQEARAYSLFVLVSATAFLLFLRTLRGNGSAWLWAVAAATSLLTHYFGVFLVAPEAAILAVRHGVRRLLPQFALVVSIGLVLLPLAEHQRDKGYPFKSIDLASRAAQIPQQFLIGYGIWSEPLGKVAGVLTGCLIGVGLALVVRHKAIFHKVRPALVVALAGLAGPVVLALAGPDYVMTRNVIAALVPASVAVAYGWSRSIAGTAAAGGYAVIALMISLAIVVEPQFQRQDLRGVVNALGDSCRARAIVVSPIAVLGGYAPDLRKMASAGAVVSEIAIVGLPRKEPGEPPVVPRELPRSVPIAGFHRFARVDGDRFTVVRFRWTKPVHTTPAELTPSRFGDWPPDQVVVFVEPACG